MDLMSMEVHKACHREPKGVTKEIKHKRGGTPQTLLPDHNSRT